MTTPPHFARHNNHSSTAPSSTHTTPMLAPASVSDSSQNAVLLSMQSPTRVIPQPISLPPLSSLTLPSGMTTPSRGSVAAQFAVSPPDRSSLAGDSVAVSPSGLSRVGIMEEVHNGRPFSMLPSSIMTVSPMLPALHDERGVSSSTSQQQQPLSLVASPPAKQRPVVAEGRPSRNSSLHLAQPLLGNTSNLSGSFDSVSAVQETDANANSNRSIRSTTGDAPRASRPRGLSRSGRSNLSDTSSSLIAMRPTVGTAAQSSAARRQHHLALSPTMQEPQQGSRSASCCGEEGTEGGAGGVPSSAFRNPHPLRDDLDMDHLEIQHEIATLLEDLGGPGHPHQDSPLIQTPHPPEPQQGDSELQSSRPGFVTLERLACATGRVPLGSNESNRLVESILQSSPASSFEADSDSSFVQGRGPTIIDPMVVRLVAIVAAQHRLLQRTMHLRHSADGPTPTSIGAVGETTTTVMQSLRSAGALTRPTVADSALPPYYYHQQHDSQFFSPTNSSSGGTTATTAATTKRTSSGLTKEHSAATTASHHHLTASNADCTTGLGSVEEQALLGETDEGKTTLHKGSFTAIPHSKQRGGLHSRDEQDDSNESASFHRRESLQRETTFLESVAGMNSEEELPPPVPQDDTASMADDGGTEVQDGEDRPERYSQLFAVLEPDTAHPRRGTVQADASGAVPLKRTAAGATSPDDHHSVSSRAGPSRNFPVGSFASGGGEDFRNVRASGVGIGWGSINSASHVTSSAHTTHNRPLECNEGDDYVDDRSSSSGGVRTSHHTAAVNSLADLPSVSRQTLPPSHESTPLDLGSNSTHPTPPPMFSPPADPQLQAPNPTVDMLHQSGMSNTVNHSHSASLLRYAPEGEPLSQSSRTDGMNVIGSGSNLSSSKNEAREDVPSSLLELHPPPPPTPPSAPTAGQLLDGDGNPTFEHSSSSVQSSIIPPSLLPLGAAGLVRKSAKQTNQLTTSDLATTPPPSTSQHTVMMHSGSGGMMMAPNASNSLSGGPPPSLHTALSLSGEAMGLRATFSSLRQVTISPQHMVAGGNKAGSGALPSTARRLSSRYTQPLGDFVHQQQQQLNHNAAGLSVESQPLIGFATASQNSSYQGVVDLALGGGGGGPPDGLGSTIAPAGGLLPVTAPYADTCEASVSSIGSLRVNRRLIMKQADVQTDETGAMTLNDYLVMDCIGQGSYGQVFRALCVEPELPEGALGIQPTFEGAQKFVAIKSLQQEKLMRRRTVMEGGDDMSPFLRGLQQREAMPASPLAVGMVLDSSPTARGAAAAARRMTTTLLSTVASAYQMLPSRTTTPQARQQHAHHHTSSNFNPYVRSLTSNEHGDQAVVMTSSVKMPNSAAMELPPDPTASKQAHQQAVLDFIEFLDTKIIKEIAIMKQLRNKHIVQLYEAILDPVARKVYLVMQYVGGGCILDRVTFSAGVVPAASPFGSASRRGAPHPFDSSVSPSTDTETPESTSGGLFGLGNVPSLKKEEKESQRLWKEAASRGEVVYKPLSRERILRYVRQIVAGLHYLHHKGILHRDIKPENILLDETGQHCYLADFGVSEIVSEGEVGDVGRVLIGTPYYIAPEVFEHVEGARLTPAVDVWALGVTVFAMATGRLPFYGTKQEDIKKKILYSEPEYPPETQLDVGLAELIKCMLKKNPRERITITMLRFGVRNNSTTVTAQSNIPHLQLPSRVTSRRPSAGPLILSPEEEDMAGGIVTIDISPTTSPSNDARLQNVGPSPFSRPGTQYDGEGGMGPEGSTTAAPLPPPSHHYPNPPVLADGMSGLGFFEPTPLLGPSAAPDGPLCAIVEEMLQFGSFASPEWRGDTQTMEDLTGQYAAALVNGNLPERVGNNEWLSSPTQNPRAAHTAVVGAANGQPPAFLIATAGPQHQPQQSHPPPLAQARHGSSSSPNSTPNRGFSPVPHHHANPDHWLLPSPTAGEPLLLPTSAVHRWRSTSSTATVLSDVGGAAGNAVATAGGGTAPMGSGGMRMSIPTFPYSATAAAPWSTASHAPAGATTTTLLPPPIPDLFDDDQCSTATNTVSLVGGPTVGGNHHTAASGGGGGSNVVHHGGGSLTVPQQRSLVRVRTSSSLATRGDSMTERVTEEQLNAAFRILLPH